jgi:putative MATE family efflux protein
MKTLAIGWQKITEKGESVVDILKYWYPELITTMILQSLAPIVDSFFIAQLGSLTTYGAMGMAASFLHTLFKWSEVVPVAATAVIGRHNGAQEFEKCGNDLGDTFWTTFLLGFLQLALIGWGAVALFHWIGVPEDMVSIGATFLRLKSIGVLLTFTFIGFVGFMRGIKNTRIPMIINLSGILIFILFDYLLIFGKFGFPALGINGSSIATIIQYGSMNLMIICYILFKTEYKKYFSKLFFFSFNMKHSLHLLNLSWPILVDKSAVAMSYVWLAKMIAPMGKVAISSFDVIIKLERFAILPAAAFAQVITFLVSNRLGAQDPDGATSNIKKVLMLASVFVFTTLITLCINSEYFVGIFDPKNQFTSIAAAALTPISLLVIFDFIQLVLAGALRGAGDVKTVMWGRALACSLFFVPVSWFMHQLPIESVSTKITLIYGSFYVTTAVMGIIFLARMKSHKWQNQKV